MCIRDRRIGVSFSIPCMCMIPSLTKMGYGHVKWVWSCKIFTHTLHAVFSLPNTTTTTFKKLCTPLVHDIKIHNKKAAWITLCLYTMYLQRGREYADIFRWGFIFVCLRLLLSYTPYYSVNVLQSVHLVYFALPHLNASRGIIVPVSSTTGRSTRSLRLPLIE